MARSSVHPRAARCFQESREAGSVRRRRGADRRLRADGAERSAARLATGAGSARRKRRSLPDGANAAAGRRAAPSSRVKIARPSRVRCGGGQDRGRAALARRVGGTRAGGPGPRSVRGGSIVRSRSGLQYDLLPRLREVAAGREDPARTAWRVPGRSGSSTASRTPIG